MKKRWKQTKSNNTNYIFKLPRYKRDLDHFKILIFAPDSDAKV